MSQQPPPKPAKLKLRRRAAPSTQEPLTEAPTPLSSRPSTKSQSKNPARKDAQPPNVPKTHKSAHSNEPGDISFEQLVEMLGDDMLSLNALFHADADADAGSDAATAADGK